MIAKELLKIAAALDPDAKKAVAEFKSHYKSMIDKFISLSKKNGIPIKVEYSAQVKDDDIALAIRGEKQQDQSWNYEPFIITTYKIDIYLAQPDTDDKVEQALKDSGLSKYFEETGTGAGSFGRDITYREKDSVRKQRTAAKKDDEGDEDDVKTQSSFIRRYRNLLMKMIGTQKDKAKVEAINKLKYIIDNKRLRKPDRYWLLAIDKGTGAGSVGNMQDWIKQLVFIFRNKLPTARILEMILDYGVENGYMALKRVLENDRARIAILGEEEIKNR